MPTIRPTPNGKRFKVTARDKLLPVTPVPGSTSAGVTKRSTHSAQRLFIHQTAALPLPSRAD
ncbi:hypothetical protein [Pigmentiphaga litoralis]|uniref:hypothetical protein n=1 Tax=Pigmentiphaga litoralis TaxID=516702 RepID=UPI003B434C35